MFVRHFIRQLFDGLKVIHFTAISKNYKLIRIIKLIIIRSLFRINREIIYAITPIYRNSQILKKVQIKTTSTKRLIKLVIFALYRSKCYEMILH